MANRKNSKAVAVQVAVQAATPTQPKGAYVPKAPVVNNFTTRKGNEYTQTSRDGAIVSGIIRTSRNGNKYAFVKPGRAINLGRNDELCITVNEAKGKIIVSFKHNDVKKAVPEQNPELALEAEHI